MSKEYIMKIGNKDFLLGSEYNFMLFSENNVDKILYEGHTVQLSSKYNFPEKKGKEYPIKMRYNPMGFMKVNIADNINYNVLFPNEHTIIHSNSKVKVNNNSYFIIKDKSDNKNRKSTNIIQIEEKQTESSDNSTSEIQNTIKNMYEDTDLVRDKNDVYSSDLDVILDIDKLEGISKIGNGTVREAYKIIDDNALNLNKSYKGKIIKIAKSQEGINENKREFNTWSVVRSHNVLNNKFCPIVYHGPDFKYNIMEECKPIGNDKTPVERIRQTLRVFINEESIKNSNDRGLDIKSRNIGKYNGEYVLLDYPYGGSFVINSTN